MKKQILITAILICGCFSLFAENKVNIVLYENVETGETITVGLNKKGIINKIEGSMESFSFRDITITEKKENEFGIKLGYTFNRAIYHDIIIHNDSVEVISTDLFTKEDKITKINFGKEDYLVKDEFITIKLNTPSSFESVFNPKPKSVLPRIKFENNTAYKGSYSMAALSYKYEYLLSEDKCKVIFYGQAPEEGWDYHNTFNIKNIKSEDKIVNLVNSIILNLHNEIFGCEIFPLLMGDFIK